MFSYGISHFPMVFPYFPMENHHFPMEKSTIFHGKTHRGVDGDLCEQFMTLTAEKWGLPKEKSGSLSPRNKVIFPFILVSI
jgi:hypothetical protein